MAYDGKLQFNTAIDTAGFLSGLNDINSIAQKGLGTIAGFAQTGINGIASFAESSGEAILKSINLTIKGMETVGKEALKLAKSAVEIGKSFESSMSQVAATMGITKDTINQSGVKPFDILSEAAKECGATTQFSASQAAEALNYLALAGYTAEQAADALPSVLNLAAAGGLELQYAADLATDAMAALGITANNQNLTEFGDKMAKAAQKSNTSVGQLGEAILTVGGTAKELAGGTTELNTALGIFANVGIKGSEGGTALRNIMLAMTPTTDKAVEAFDRLNVSAYDAEGNLRPLNDTFKDLNKAMSGMTSKEKTETLNAIFNKVDLKSASAMLAACASSTEELGTAFSYAGVPAQHLTKFLEDFENGVYNTLTEEEFLTKMTNEFGVKTQKADAIYSAFVTQLNGVSWEKLYNEIENCDGAMEQMAETMNDNLEGDLKIWNSALEGFGISFYESITDNLRATVQEATKWIGQLDEAFKADGFNGLAEEFPKVLSEMLKKAYLEIPDLLKFGSEIIETVGKGIKENSSQIKIYGSTLITKFVESFADNFSVFYDTGFSMLSALAVGLGQDSSRLADTVSSVISGIAQTLEKNIPAIAESGAKLFTALAAKLPEILPMVINSAGVIIKSLLKTIRSSLPELLKAGKQIINNILAGTLGVPVDETMSDIAIEILTSLAEFIIENIPAIVDVGLTILENLLQGISDGINDIMPVVTKVIESLCNIITEHLPEVLQIGFDILMSLIDGILDNLPTLIDAAVDILVSIAEFIGDNIDLLIDAAILIITTICDELLTEENLKKLVNAAMEILKGLAKGISDNLSLLIDCATDILDEIGNYLNDSENQSDLMKSLGELVGTIVRGLIDSIPELSDFVDKIYFNIGQAILDTDWAKLGKGIVDGILSGLFDIEWDSDEFMEYFCDYYNIGGAEVNVDLRSSFINKDELENKKIDITANTEQFDKSLDEIYSNKRTIEFDVRAGNMYLPDINKERLLSDNLLLNQFDTEAIATRLEDAVAANQNLITSEITKSCEPIKDISGEVQKGFEEALNNVELDGDTYLNVNIGQERIESIVISAMEKYNARTGGRY